MFKALFLLNVIIISITLFGITNQQRPFMKDPPKNQETLDGLPITDTHDKNGKKIPDTHDQPKNDGKNNNSPKEENKDHGYHEDDPSNTPKRVPHAPEPPNYYKPSPPPCRKGFVVRKFHAKSHHPEDLCVHEIKNCNQYSPVVGDCQECRLFFKRAIDEQVKALTRRGISTCKVNQDLIVPVQIALQFFSVTIGAIIYRIFCEEQMFEVNVNNPSLKDMKKIIKESQKKKEKRDYKYQEDKFLNSKINEELDKKIRDIYGEAKSDKNYQTYFDKSEDKERLEEETEKDIEYGQVRPFKNPPNLVIDKKMEAMVNKSRDNLAFYEKRIPEDIDEDIEEDDNAGYGDKYYHDKSPDVNREISFVHGMLSPLDRTMDPLNQSVTKSQNLYSDQKNSKEDK